MTSEEKELTKLIADLKKELENIPMRKEYTTYVKVERKILAAQTKLNDLRTTKQTQNLIFQFGVPYGSQIVLSLVLVIISIYYRYAPVIVFDTYRYNFVPFGSLIRFPTGVDGGVSVPFWIFVNSYVSRHIAAQI